MKLDDTANPLLGPLRELLCEAGDGYTEHSLIKIMVARELLPADFSTSPRKLFHAHFVLFNALYRLKDELFARNLGLAIGLVDVRVYAISTARESAVDTPREAKLRTFYLDWQHHADATDASVQALLDDFWRQFQRLGVASDDKARALDALGLDDSADYREIKQRYRRLAMQAHPDRGGDTQTLQEINGAMSVLQRCYRSGE
ncbi:DNA-J related domain-containing protein [Gilvimarinus xylanilyticus]|uniref:DnaJ domain-containing protein n=1 Tax=Gilvimarinus xylanilyticus TaxID=2944139 RepID=A0A9X2KT74_9GAMM|nr:DNA-J related domain-containing protein [Gilvimarinus xylanilyticus]MCP8898887.1 DnaJ domain-containing protein [Gilvimarinus xylanilyticus]